MGGHEQDQEHAEPARPPLNAVGAREMTAGLREAMNDVRVERQLWPEGARQEARLRRVVFVGADGYRPYGPHWSGITEEQLQDLVGAEVDTDRGPGYVPRPTEAEPRLVFEEFAVAGLARPRPFRQPDCMPAGVPWWRRRLRQALPRRGARSCCWYHGGDWHTVNAMALQGVDGDDMEEFAIAHAAVAGATEWQSEALAALFDTADAMQGYAAPLSCGTSTRRSRARAPRSAPGGASPGV